MVHGTPDWGDRNPKKTTYTLSDMSELAVRLGSPVNFDRRGDVLWINNFENGGRGLHLQAGAVDREVYLTSDQVSSGGICLALYTGAAYPSLVAVMAYLRYVVSGLIGIELTFAPDTNMEYLKIYLYVYTGVFRALYICYYKADTGTLTVVDSALAQQTIGTCGVVYNNGKTYSTIKMVIDTTLLAYRRVMINELSFDASAWTPAQVADVTPSRVELYVGVCNTDVGGSTMRLDNIILTQNEVS